MGNYINRKKNIVPDYMFLLVGSVEEKIMGSKPIRIHISKVYMYFTPHSEGQSIRKI